MGNICKGEARQSDPEIELAPRVAQQQQAPANVQLVPEPDAPPEASRGTNDRRTRHDPTPNTQQPRKQCRSYAKGYCEKGDSCRFLHERLKNVDKEERSKVLLHGLSFMFATPDTPLPQDDKRTLDSLREFRGAWVEFGPGATTFQVALPSDFSAIRIDNLPAGCSTRNIKDMLWRAGLNISRCDVYINNPKKRTAMIRSWHLPFPKEACRKLCARTSGLEVVSIPPPLPVKSNLRQVDCRQVRCTWYRSSREINLIFGTPQAAGRLHRSYPAGLTVRGYQVGVLAPVLRANHAGDACWVVKLTGLPESVRDQDIVGLIPKRYWSFQIQVKYLAYTDDAGTESTFVRSMLDEFGPFEEWEVSGMSDGGEIKAQAVFLEESQARNAAAVLDGKRLPFSKSRRLIAEVVTSVRFDVLYRVYVAVQDQIDARKRSWEEQNIQFTDSPPRGCSLTLYLKGSDRESMARAKQELDLILSGDVMRYNGKNIWHSSFSDCREADEGFKTIEEEMGIVVILDAWLSQLQVFGAEGRQEQVAEALDRFVKDKVSSLHFIPLDQENGLELRGDLERGLQELRSKLGKDKVGFDESSRSIVIHGSKNDFVKAKQIMARGQPGSSRDRLMQEQDCEICLCEAEDPVMTSCKHVYCAHCFVNMCYAAAEQPGETGIICEGDSGECGHVFEFFEIRDLLPSETFEDVLQESFTTFVQTHQEKFRYCPTPDCTQVYRVASQTEEPPPTYTCNSCLACICTGCHAAHPSLTCAEHQDQTSGGLQALNTLKKKLGIQDCPRCTTSLEKTAGCDHVTCQGCNTHICWICMAKFDHGDACYQHLMGVHRGGDFD
ncbi:hypothetical protein BHE90_006012 [Fusarium euwallaceae]|uniref:Uncharacterized protein n=1 Tax=Fusarium euwallaceae TaxID=1147111 RepID=A0A430LUU5_9HYPO|nr:hypothetical protein BHE90_006012 [Fusarium euwallaceae]